MCIEFIISSLNELERSSCKENLFKEFVRKYNIKTVPAVGTRRCMFDQHQESLGNDLMMIGKAQATSGRKFVSQKAKDSNHLKKIMLRKFGDPIHIDSATNAGADFFLTIDGPLLRNVLLKDKIMIGSPMDFCNNYIKL